MTVHTFDRDHEIDRSGAARAASGVLMTVAFGTLFLVVLAQIFSVIG